MDARLCPHARLRVPDANRRASRRACMWTLAAPSSLHPSCPPGQITISMHGAPARSLCIVTEYNCRKQGTACLCHMRLPPPAAPPRRQGLARLAQARALKRTGGEARGGRLRAHGERAAGHVAAAAERDGHAVRAGLRPAQAQAPRAAACRQRRRHAATRAGGACAARLRRSRQRRMLGRRLGAT